MRPFSRLTERGRARRLRTLVEAALVAYDLPWTHLRLIDNGWNGVFRVETLHGPKVLRVSRPTPTAAPRSVRSEADFMTALAHGTDVAVPAVIPNRDGSLVTRASAAGVPEPRDCVLFGWLGGRDLAERVSATNWDALGELMGRMHRFARDWEPPIDFRAATYDSVLPYGEPLVLFEPGRVDLLGLDSLLREAIEQTNERIRALGRDQRRIVVHGDLHGWNVKIRRGVLSPFDFEDILVAAPILDVATSLYYVRQRPDYPVLAGAFRAGYERQQPWVESEPGELDGLLFARAVDMLNTAVIGPDLDIDDWGAFIRRREELALIAVGKRPPFVIPGRGRGVP